MLKIGFWYITYLQVIKNAFATSLPVTQSTSPPFFCQFMRNAFLGKSRLYQGKITFRLKAI